MELEQDDEVRLSVSMNELGAKRFCKVVTNTDRQKTKSGSRLRQRRTDQGTSDSVRVECDEIHPRKAARFKVIRNKADRLKFALNLVHVGLGDSLSLCVGSMFSLEPRKSGECEKGILFNMEDGRRSQLTTKIGSGENDPKQIAVSSSKGLVLEDDNKAGNRHPKIVIESVSISIKITRLSRATIACIL